MEREICCDISSYCERKDIDTDICEYQWYEDGFLRRYTKIRDMSMGYLLSRIREE